MPFSMHTFPSIHYENSIRNFNPSKTTPIGNKRTPTSPRLGLPSFSKTMNGLHFPAIETSLSNWIVNAIQQKSGRKNYAEITDVLV